MLSTVVWRGDITASGVERCDAPHSQFSNYQWSDKWLLTRTWLAWDIWVSTAQINGMLLVWQPLFQAPCKLPGHMFWLQPAGIITVPGAAVADFVLWALTREKGASRVNARSAMHPEPLLWGAELGISAGIAGGFHSSAAGAAHQAVSGCWLCGTRLPLLSLMALEDPNVARADPASSGLTCSEVLLQRLEANPSEANCGTCADWFGLCLFPYEAGRLCNMETIMTEEEINCH